MNTEAAPVSACRSTAGLNAEILALAIPSIAALVADPLLSFADTAMIGRLGVDQLAALAIATSLFGAFSWTFNFLTMGATAVVARHLGAGDREACGRTAAQAIVLAAAIGSIMAVVGYLLAPWLYAVMGGSGRVAELGIAYFRIRIFAMPAVLIFFVTAGFLRGLQNARLPLYIVLVINLTNVVLDYGLIYGKLGLPAMGIRGGALASLIAQGVGLATCLKVMFFSGYTHRYATRTIAFRMREFWPFLHVSRDLFLRTIMLLLAIVTTTAVSARMGKVPLAAHQIGIQLWLLGALLIDGFAVAGQALTGKHLGAGQQRRAFLSGRLLLGWGVSLGLGVALLYAGASGWLVSIFTRSPEVISTIKRVLPIIILFQPINGVAFILDGVLIGASDTAFLRRMMTIGSLLICIPLSISALHFGWGLYGVWSALAALMVFRSSTHLYRFLGRAWLRASPAIERVNEQPFT